MKNKSIFVTGASGFIGNALVTKLLKDVTVDKIVLFSRKDKFEDFCQQDPRVVSVIGDINNVELLVYILQAHTVTHVYHLASQAIISQYTKNPRQAYLDTVYGVTSLLEAVRISEVPVEKVIVSTSYKVYGRAEPPYNEETYFLPGNTYETAKACQDFIAQDYFRTFKVPVIIFRTVNVYGPGDKNQTRLIPRSFSNIYEGNKPVVYSSFKDKLREFVYIDDLIDGILLITEKANPGDVYCIGGQQHTVYDVAKAICEVTGYGGGVEITENSLLKETSDHALDSSKIKNLGWSIKVSLKEGLIKTGEYYKNNLATN